LTHQLSRRGDRIFVKRWLGAAAPQKAMWTGTSRRREKEAKKVGVRVSHISRQKTP
jgi:hypothetical protein